MEKRCTKCGDLRPLEEFRPNVRYKDGFINWCKRCEAAYRRQYYQQNKERQSALAAQWEARHPEAIQRYRTRYRLAHPERLRERKKRGKEKYARKAAATRRDYDRRVRAVEAAKQDFASCGHFLLVQGAAGYWYAMRPGRPIGRTEQIVARYLLLGVYSGGVRTWFVVRPDIAPRGTADLLRRLSAREERLCAEAAIKQLERDLNAE